MTDNGGYRRVLHNHDNWFGTYGGYLAQLAGIVIAGLGTALMLHYLGMTVVETLVTVLGLLAVCQLVAIAVWVRLSE